MTRRDPVDELLDLADEVSRAANSGPQSYFHLTVDEYADALRALAVLLRGGRS